MVESEFDNTGFTEGCMKNREEIQQLKEELRLLKAQYDLLYKVVMNGK